MRTIFAYVVASLLALAVVEGAVRAYEMSQVAATAEGVEGLLQSLPEAKISGREIGNQFLIHNVALFKRFPNPEAVHTAFVGTSRSKVLRPARFGLADAVNGSGNSYSEISYGLLLQAEILRLQFPNLRKVYVEAPVLMRRRDGLVMERDHQKYFPLLHSLMPLIDQLDQAKQTKAEIINYGTYGGAPDSHLLHFVRYRSDLRLTNLYRRLIGADGSIPVYDDAWFKTVRTNGERIGLSAAMNASPSPPIAREHPKVQRLDDIRSNFPWDGLFDLFAIWGKTHHIQIVLYQPPVRSDVLEFEQEYGLDLHVEDLKRVSKKYQIPFIDLEREGLGFAEDWGLFSDEDHMETCTGSILLFEAILQGEAMFEQDGQLFPAISRRAAESASSQELASCNGK
ncbi:hypothetical protein FHX10_004429 [Rhizobium sp. BK591]|uniref:hypothetical protein n=1 Tax=Rhizobium sp. BK591 TaxID=2586985 RepID=UPI0010537970|nr:hypothetical protein [Rhizobium sp. BK591]MBB3744904.1 hypothetical protein [Rhizobium sp. BK591]